MLINGEKYACDACIRGHRVSSCQHHEKVVLYLNVHIVEVYGKVEPVTSVVSAVRNHIAKVTARTGQWIKRDSNLATVPEVGPVLNPQKSTLQGKQSQISSTKIDTPAVPHRQKVKQNNARKRAHPYPMPRSHTIQSPRDLTRYSAENISLAEEMGISRSVPGHQESITSAPRDHLRRARSEHGSPVLGLTRLDTQVPPLELPYSAFDQASLPSPAFDYSQPWSGLYYPDADVTLEAASLGPPSVDWSTFDLAYGSDAIAATYSQPPSYASFDYANFSHPELSRSSSHSSEPDEFNSMGMSMQVAKSEGLEIRALSDSSDAEAYHLSASPSHLDMPQPRISDPSHVESLELDLYWRASEGMSQPTPLSNIPLGPELQQYSQSQAFQPQQASTPIDRSISLSSTSVFTTAESSEPIWIPSTSPFPPVLSPVPMETGPIVDQNQWQS
ncbi:transcriptional activator haa1 [Emydomyces testavorans]|uniref:Transcriptional activator haa1 n=1 Tax=Emydomyces testavorans TaxID=2070801 RepID=A0AAF0DHA1_9EURO|nr:transcriptional activator haa1 [Emydomyces testavorans]